MTMPDPDALTTPIGFAESVLCMRLYPWQDEALTWFEDAVGKRVKGSLCTPNGAGKDSVVIAALSLWWVSMHRRGRVVITSKDSRQIDEQTCPAIERHRGKFPGWKFIERYVETPTGGKIILFTTDDPGRAEGFHRETLEDGASNCDGPLLLIANEAKSIPESLFTAFDRCTYDALLYASSPGPMSGRFYDSQFRGELGFNTLRIGLKDCPHIPPERIADIIATYGANSAFTLSTLEGMFMEAEGEARFDRDGLDHLAAMADAGHDLAPTGHLESNRGTGRTVYMPGDDWLWIDEEPTDGLDYLIFCDPNTCEQAGGTTDRDNTACGVLRDAYRTPEGDERNVMLAAALTWPGGVKWDSDVLAERMAMLSDFYGGCTVVCEANNFGSALMTRLQLEYPHVPLWQRTKVDDINPNKKHRSNGYLTSGKTREHWVQACAKVVREKQITCRFKPATSEFATFILGADGKAQAQDGCHDDWVSGIGIGLVVRCYSTYSRRAMAQALPPKHSGVGGWHDATLHIPRRITKSASPFGACG